MKYIITNAEHHLHKIYSLHVFSLFTVIINLSIIFVIFMIFNFFLLYYLPILVSLKYAEMAILWTFVKLFLIYCAQLVDLNALFTFFHITSTLSW